MRCRVVPVMQGIAEKGRDTAVVLAAVREVTGDAFGKDRVLLAQQVAYIVEPDGDCRQVLG